MRTIPEPTPPTDASPPPPSNALTIAAAYAAHATDLLLPLPQMNECSTRQALDQAVCTALALDPETVATIRRHLAAEPSITAKRYAP